MKNSKVHTTIKIPSPSWDQVRTLYKKLSDEFNILTDSYKIELSEETKIHLDHLIIVIDDVDQCVDETTDKATRDSITSSLVAYLDNEEELWSHPQATSLMKRQIGIIKTIILQEGIQEEFIEAAKTIFEVTELKRHTDSIEELIRLIKIEGEATARLPLSILKVGHKEKFGVFFSRLCMLMGIADLIFDAREDFKLGYILIRPTFKLYLQLIRITIVEGVKLVLSFPNKIKFLIYCSKFALALIKE